MSGAQKESLRRPGEMVFSILLIVFSVTAFWQSYAISGLRGLSEPGVFPMLASATMLLSSLVIMRELMAKGSTSQDRQSSFLRDIVPLRLLVVVGFILAYVVAMPLIGFVFSSAVFLFASFWLLWRKGPVISAALTLASLAIVYIVFRMVFQVVLPGGSMIRGII